MQYNIYIAKTN